MTKKYQPSEAAAAGFDAFRVFFDAALDPVTIFDVSAGVNPVNQSIRFRGTMGWGSIIRDKQSLTINVNPNKRRDERFSSHKLVLNASDYAESYIFTASSREFEDEDGRTFSRNFANICFSKSANYQIAPAGANLHLIEHAGKFPESIQHIRTLMKAVEDLAQPYAQCITALPAFDMPAECFMIPLVAGGFRLDRTVTKEIDGIRDRLNLLPRAYVLSVMDNGPIPSVKIEPYRVDASKEANPSKLQVQLIIANGQLDAMAKKDLEN